MKSAPVLLAPEARDEARVIDAWWREHRPLAPRLFEEELSNALALLAGAPMIGSPYPHPLHRGVRRFLLRSTRYHVYYRLENDAVIVLSIWSAVRDSGPDLTGFGHH